MTTIMRTPATKLVAAAVAVAVIACAVIVYMALHTTRLTDAQYQQLCWVYGVSQRSLGTGRYTAQQWASDNWHLSRADAADAVDTARREYCPA